MITHAINRKAKIGKIICGITSAGGGKIKWQYMKDHGWRKKRGMHLAPLDLLFQQKDGDANNQAHEISMKNRFGHIILIMVLGHMIGAMSGWRTNRIIVSVIYRVIFKTMTNIQFAFFYMQELRNINIMWIPRSHLLGLHIINQLRVARVNSKCLKRCLLHRTSIDVEVQWGTRASFLKWSRQILIYIVVRDTHFVSPKMTPKMLLHKLAGLV